MKSYYERYWQQFEELSDFPYKWPVIKRYIPIKKSISILDFGCGKGKILSEMKKINPNAQYTGVDVSRKALEYIKKHDKKTKLYKIVDGGKIPFNNGSFDFIIASDVLEHVYDTENVFVELSRVLKKGGKILISVPYNGLIKRTLTALFFFDYIYEPNSPHIRFYTKRSMSKYLEKNGISVEKVGYYGRFFPISSGMYILSKKM